MCVCVYVHEPYAISRRAVLPGRQAIILPSPALPSASSVTLALSGSQIRII